MIHEDWFQLELRGKKEIKGDLIYDDPISRKKGGEAGGEGRDLLVELKMRLNNKMIRFWTK